MRKNEDRIYRKSFSFVEMKMLRLFWLWMKNDWLDGQIGDGSMG